MEIFVKCPSCASKYSFVEEPVNGRLRFPVSCTNCGVDGTAEANEYIRKSVSGELEQEKQRNKQWWRRIFRRVDDDDDDIVPTEETNSGEPKPVKTGLGIAGACAGGFVGMMVWFGVTTWSGWEIGIVAWAVGILAGLGARLFVPNGNFTMASVAAFSALIAIMGGQFLAYKSIFTQYTAKAYAGAYGKALAYAKDTVKSESEADFAKLVKKYPTALLTFRDEVSQREGRTDQDRVIQLGYMFRTYGEGAHQETMQELIEEMAGDPLTSEELERFRNDEVPFLTQLAAGQPDKVAFDKIIKENSLGNISTREMILQSWSPYQLLWIFLGVGSAYKLAFNKSETEDV